MDPVQPVGGNAPGPQPIQGASSARGATAATSTTTVTAMSNSVSVSMVNTQVDSMLQAIGGGVQDNQLLRMVIGLLIMQALLAKDGGSQQAAIDGLMSMLGQRGGSQTQAVSMHSATNVVQIQQQSTVLMTGQAALAATGTEGGQSGTGAEVDVSA